MQGEEITMRLRLYSALLTVHAYLRQVEKAAWMYHRRYSVSVKIKTSKKSRFPVLCWLARTQKGLGKATVTVITPRWHLILLPKIKQRKGRTAGDTIQADKKSISPLTPDLQQPWNNHLKKKKSQMTYTHPLQADIRLERQDGKDYFSFHILSYFVSVYVSTRFDLLTNYFLIYHCFVTVQHMFTTLSLWSSNWSFS